MKFLSVFSSWIIVIGLLLMIGISPSFAQDQPAGKIVNIRDNVEVFSADAATWQQVKPGFVLHQGDQIRTGANGWAAVLLADESLVQINRNSVLSLKSVSQTAAWKTAIVKRTTQSTYRMVKGSMWLRNKNKVQYIEMELPAAVIEVRGTELSLTVDDDGTTVLTVLEGLVQARNEYGSLNVQMHEQVIAKLHTPLIKTVLLSPEDSVQWTIPIPPLFADRAIPANVQKAFFSLQSGNIKQTQKMLDDIMRAQPAESSAWSLYAVTSLMLGEKEQAIETASKAVALSPSSVMAWVSQSFAYQANFDLDRSLKAVQKAISLDPDNPTALLQLARLLFGMDDVEGAQRTIERVWELAPENGEVQNLFGFIYLALRNQDEAIAAFKRAVLLDPSLGEAHMGLGLAYMRKGEIVTCMEEITTANLLEPRRSLFLSYWGKMLYQLERFERALEILDLAARLDPRDPTPELYRAIILRDMNRPTEAIGSLNHAIALNDNRAVYRSRFLLDRDLAVKNVDLSILYNQLGLSEWSKSKALASIKQDYANSSAHLFLGGSLQDADDRSWAMQNEYLLARLLMPANMNSFNTFNEYTPFFERPSLNARISGTIGNEAKRSADIIPYGAMPSADLAFGAQISYDKNDGWRDINGEKSENVAILVKWDASPKDSLMAVFSHQRSKIYGDLYPRFEYDSAPSANNWTEDGMSRWELGYHRQLSVHSGLLLYLASVKNEIDSRVISPTAYGSFNYLLPPVVSIDYSLDRIDNYHFVSSSYYQAQGQYMLRLGLHQFVIGTNQYWGTNEMMQTTNSLIKYFYVGTQIKEEEVKESVNRDNPAAMQSYYVYDTFRVNRLLTLEVALYLDRMTNSDPQKGGTSWTINEVGPRVGLIFTPSTTDTVRLAMYRYLLPFISSRLDPTDVAGVTVIRNNMAGSVVRESDLIWEHGWTSGFLSTGLFYADKNYEHYVIDAANTTVYVSDSGRLKGGELKINQLLWQGFGFNASYRYQDIQDETLPSADREDHLIKAGLRYVHYKGLSFGLSEIYRHLRMKSITRDDEDIWLTDGIIGYEFPRKKGSINIEVRNILNQHFNWVMDYFVTTGRAPSREVLLTLILNI